MEAEGPERELGAECLAPDTGAVLVRVGVWAAGLTIGLQSSCPSTLGTEVICPMESVTAGQKEVGR